MRGRIRVSERLVSWTDLNVIVGCFADQGATKVHSVLNCAASEGRMSENSAARQNRVGKLIEVTWVDSHEVAVETRIKERDIEVDVNSDSVEGSILRLACASDGDGLSLSDGEQVLVVREVEGKLAKSVEHLTILDIHSSRSII